MFLNDIVFNESHIPAVSQGDQSLHAFFPFCSIIVDKRTRDRYRASTKIGCRLERCCHSLHEQLITHVTFSRGRRLWGSLARYFRLTFSEPKERLPVHFQTKLWRVSLLANEMYVFCIVHKEKLRLMVSDRYAIRELVHTFTESWMHAGSLESTRKASVALRQSHLATLRFSRLSLSSLDYHWYFFCSYNPYVQFSLILCLYLVHLCCLYFCVISGLYLNQLC